MYIGQQYSIYQEWTSSLGFSVLEFLNWILFHEHNVWHRRKSLGFIFFKTTKQFESDILRVIWDSSKIIHFNIFGITAACSWDCYLAFMTFADCTKLVSSPYVLPCVVVHICYCNSRGICIMRLHLWY